MQAPEITTERLLLRGLRESDLDAYAEMNADPEVRRYLGDDDGLDRAGSWRELAMIIGHWDLRGFGFWALEERGTGAFVGRAGCWRPEGWPGSEIGWTLARAHWGKGYATEAGAAALAHAREVLGWDEVVSVIHVDNERSERVARRLGGAAGPDVEIRGHPCRLWIY